MNHSLKQQVTAVSGKGSKPPALELCRLTAAADKIREREYGRLARSPEAAAEIIPERNPQLGTSLGQPEEGIATVPSNIAAGATADPRLRGGRLFRLVT